MAKKKNKNKRKKNKNKNKNKVAEQLVKELEAAEENKAAREEAIEAWREQAAKAKELATAAGEPWVDILHLDVDYENLDNGYVELDWNDLFVAKLVRAGYQGKTDHDIVDQWYINLCRHIVLETFEQEQADKHPIRSRKLDDDRREYE